MYLRNMRLLRDIHNRNDDNNNNILDRELKNHRDLVTFLVLLDLMA